MKQLVTKEEARTQLMLDDSADDAWLEIAIDAVTHAIEMWASNVFDDNDHPNKIAKQAALVELAYQYRYREGNTEDVQDWILHGYPLSPGAVMLLQPLHKPRVQ